MHEKILWVFKKACNGDCFKKKKMKVLTNKQQEWYENFRVRDDCHYIGKYRAAHSICDLKYSVSKEIPVNFHNESNYDYHFITKELAKAFDGKFNCSEEKQKNK